MTDKRVFHTVKHKDGAHVAITDTHTPHECEQARPRTNTTTCRDSSWYLQQIQKTLHSGAQRTHSTKGGQCRHVCLVGVGVGVGVGVLCSP